MRRSLIATFALSVMAGGCGSASGEAVDAGVGADASNGGTRDASTRDGNGGDGGASTGCKRGIATNTPPGSAFSPKVSWWYNWALSGTGPNVGIEFVPMVWGRTSVGGAIPPGSRFLLGFN